MAKKETLSPEQINAIAQQHAETFRSASSSAARSVLEMAKAVHEGYTNDISKRAVFAAFCKLTNIDPKSSTCRKYKAIGAKYQQFIEFVDYLPNNWTTLYTLTIVAPEKLREGIEQKLIDSRITAKDLKVALALLDAPLPTGAAKKRVPFSITIERGLTIEARTRIKEALESLKMEGVSFGENLINHLSSTEIAAV